METEALDVVCERVMNIVWVVRTGCRDCESSDLWAAAQIMTSQMDGTTFESRSMNTFFPLLSSHAPGKISVKHKVKQCDGKIDGAHEIPLFVAPIFGICCVLDTGLCS